MSRSLDVKLTAPIVHLGGRFAGHLPAPLPKACRSKKPAEVGWCRPPKRVGGGTVLGRLGLEEIVQETLYEALGEALVARGGVPEVGLRDESTDRRGAGPNPNAGGPMSVRYRCFRHSAQKAIL